MAHLVKVTAGTLVPHLADIVAAVLPFLRPATTPDYVTRKTAAETLDVLCTHFKDAVVPFQATIIDRLEDAKSDRIKQVRDAAVSAQCEYYALGSPAAPSTCATAPEATPAARPLASATHKRLRTPNDVAVLVCAPPKKGREEPSGAEKENAGYPPSTPSRVLADITRSANAAAEQPPASPLREEPQRRALPSSKGTAETPDARAASALHPDEAQALLQSQLRDLEQQHAEKERLLQVLRATSPRKTPNNTPKHTPKRTPKHIPPVAHEDAKPDGSGLAPIRQYDSSLTFPVGERIDAVERRIGALERGTDATAAELCGLRASLAELAAAVAAVHETCEKLAARQSTPPASSAPAFRTPARAAPRRTFETPYFARGGTGSLDWREVRQRCVTGDYGFAFGRVLAGEPDDLDQTLPYLMRKTGPVADRLPEDTTARVFRCVARWLGERREEDVCLQWVEQEVGRPSHRLVDTALVQDICDGLDALGTGDGPSGARARGLAEKLRKKYPAAFC